MKDVVMSSYTGPGLTVQTKVVSEIYRGFSSSLNSVSLLQGFDAGSNPSPLHSWSCFLPHFVSEVSKIRQVIGLGPIRLSIA